MKKPISQDLDKLLSIYSNMSPVERENEAFVFFMQMLILNAAKPEEDNDFAWLAASNA